MMQTDPIAKLVDALPQDGVTVRLLQGLDYIVPGQWQNLTGFDATIRKVTGVTDPVRVQAISKRASELYADTTQGYQRAVWLYTIVDKTDTALAAAALANKIGDRIGFLSFLNKLLPKADNVQSFDLGMKLVVEMLAYAQLNGLPRDGVAQFASSLKNYSGANLMRMAALVAVDGVLPLGPDFVTKVTSALIARMPANLKVMPLIKKSAP